MSSVRCPECNLTNWATAINCKRCGGFLQAFDGSSAQEPQQQAAGDSFAAQDFSAAAAPPQVERRQNFHAAYQNPPANNSYSEQNGRNNYQADYGQTNNQYRQPNQPNYYQPNYYQQPPPQLKSGMAIASMVIGILGCFLTAPVGVILGIVSLRRANNRPFEYGGKGFAIAGIVLNCFGFLTVPIIAAIAIPNLLAARRAANEASAISIVRTVSAAEEAYRQTAGAGRCGDLMQLQAVSLIDASVAAGQKSGYRFMVTNLPSVEGGCEIRATPVSTSTGTRSFYYSTEDGEIRAANKRGQLADRTDAPLGQGNSFSEANGSSSSFESEPLDEAKTLANLRTLSSAEATYVATAGQGKCGTLQSLAAQRLIGGALAGGEKNGYRLQVNSAPASSLGSIYVGCEIRATPASYSGGDRSFFVGDDGVIRGADKGGEMASRNDPPINY